MTEYEARNKVLIACVAGQLLHETLDELTETDFYKHSLKAAGNRFQKELTKTIDKHINDLFEVSPEAVNSLMEGIEEITKFIATSGDPMVIEDIKRILKRNYISITKKQET